MRIVSWNMNHCMRSTTDRAEAWRFMQDTLCADLAIVQEASPPACLQGMSVYHPIDKRRYKWGSAIVSFNDHLLLHERPRLPLADCYLDPPTGDQLPDSHPGACAVADVLDASGSVRFTAVSLYGQWEVMSDGRTMDSFTRMHRMLSDLAWLFRQRNAPPVILAGDFNMTSQWSSPAGVRGHVAATFARLNAMGLMECIAHTSSTRPRLDACTCLEGEKCSHVRTFRSNNRKDSEPVQLDYAFVSASMLSTLGNCEVVDSEGAWALSDHCPIVLEIDDGWTTGELEPADAGERG